jgi:hypothetical protein
MRTLMNMAGMFFVSPEVRILSSQKGLGAPWTWAKV